jgi:carboxyl-terminal processing protease
MLRFMKYKIGIPLLIIAALAAFFSFKYINQDVSSGSDQRKALTLNAVMEVIDGAHFSPRPLDDSFSNKVFNKLIESTDFEKKIFTQEDIKALGKYRYQIDDEIKNTSFEFYNAYNQIFTKRTAQTEAYFKEIIKHPFTFDGNEKIQLSGDKIDFAANEKELKERWLLYVKYRVLAKFVDLKKAQEDRKARKDTATVTIDTASFVWKDDVTLEKDARGKVDTNLQKYFTRLKKVTADERFASYINAITLSEDPHSDFFPPKQKKDFDVQMSGEFYGIGAQLKEEDGKVKIASIVTGSPCWKQGDLKAGDEIIKIGQAAAEPEDIQGYEVDEVVQKIRGDKGTEVRLTVRRTDGSIKVIPIIRGKVTLEETFAKSALINTSKGPIGYIYLNEFYSNFNSADGRRSADDVGKEVAKLKNAGVKGIILDLRYNGGGSLNDVVDMAGLFVNRGPIVQVKASKSNPMILSNRSNDGIVYDGPFAIMVNQGSASASEILAAAMQDYKRAVIVGSPTFGKGTVQKQVVLDDVIDPVIRLKMENKGEPSLGAFKLTIQKFYRINGGSTQLKGVTPDVILPDIYSEIEIGERKDKVALGWDEIKPANYLPYSKPVDVAKLKALSKKRVSTNPLFDAVSESSKRLKQLEEDNTVSLNEKKFRKDQEAATLLAKKIEELDKKVTLLDITNLKEDAGRINTDSTTIKRNTDWLRLLKKDMYISETVNILEDMDAK